MVGSPVKLWFATMIRVPRKLAFEGLSNGTGCRFAVTGGAGKRSTSRPSGAITAIWLETRWAM